MDKGLKALRSASVPAANTPLSLPYKARPLCACNEFWTGPTRLSRLTYVCLKAPFASFSFRLEGEKGGSSKHDTNEKPDPQMSAIIAGAQCQVADPLHKSAESLLQRLRGKQNPRTFLPTNEACSFSISGPSTSSPPIGFGRSATRNLMGLDASAAATRQSYNVQT